MRVMCFTAHPDDAETMCGGTLAKYKSQGHEVAIATLTRGDVGSPTLSRDEIAAVRKQEAQNSADVIGAELFWFGYDDEFLYDSPDVRRHVIDVLRQFKPDLVLCPDKDNDYHPDHQRVGQLVWDTHVMAAVRLIETGHAPCDHIHEIWYYDTVAGIAFEPEHYVDITDFWDTKVTMAKCHESQDSWMIHMYGYSIVHLINVQSQFRGYQCNCKYAEAFRKARMYPQSVRKNALLPTGME